MHCEGRQEISGADDKPTYSGRSAAPAAVAGTLVVDVEKGVSVMSLGKDRVRIDFNPSGDDLVNTIKEATANLIDLCDRQCDSGAGTEERRLWALAMTHFEDAAMWAAKAAVKRQTGHTSVTRAAGG